VCVNGGSQKEKRYAKASKDKISIILENVWTHKSLIFGSLKLPIGCWDDIIYIKTAVGLRFIEEHTVQHSYEIRGKLRT
jgi:hypothetical protein